MDRRNGHSRLKVIVRTHGNRPKVRYLWIYGNIGSVIADEQAYRNLMAGHSPLAAGAVSVPSEDIFKYDRHQRIDPDRPFDEWERLEPYGI